MKITVTSVMVEDQEKALAFYTDILGFQKKTDLPVGEYRWLTLVSPEAPDGVELLLEPTAFPPAKAFQQELFAAGIPATMFSVADCEAEYQRLVAQGVSFKGPPKRTDQAIIAMFDDTCGNYIQMVQVTG